MGGYIHGENFKPVVFVPKLYWIEIFKITYSIHVRIDCRFPKLGHICLKPELHLVITIQ